MLEFPEREVLFSPDVVVQDHLPIEPISAPASAPISATFSLSSPASLWSPSSANNSSTSLASIQRYLDFILDQLLKEEVTDATETGQVGPMLEYCFHCDLFQKLVAWTDQERDRNIRKAVIHFFASLCGMMSTSFFYASAVHKSISKLITQEAKFTRTGDCFVETVQLEYLMGLKLLQSPELLYFFFFPSLEKDQKSLFPIYDHLLQFLHLENEHGEYSRAAFEALSKKCTQEDLEEYILQTDFSSILMASLAGLYAQLPDSLPGLCKSKMHLFKKDLKGFEDLYIFCQNCLSTQSDKLRKELIVQFQDFLLAQVVNSALQSCNDLDGTALTTIFYFQRMVDLSTDEDILKTLVTFLLEVPDQPIEIDLVDQPCPRDIILSKINSISEPVVTFTLQLLASLLNRMDSTFLLPLLFENWRLLQEPVLGKINCPGVILVSEYLQFLPKDAGATSDFDAYLADAISAISLEKTEFTATTLKQVQGDIFEKNMEILKQDPTLNNLYLKLNSFFSQSVTVNVSLTGVFSLLATRSPMILYTALFAADLDPNIHSSLTRLVNYVDEYKQTISNYQTRKLMARQNVLSSLAPSASATNEYDEGQHEANSDLDMIKNVVVLDEFIKEMVSIVLMRTNE